MGPDDEEEEQYYLPTLTMNITTLLYFTPVTHRYLLVAVQTMESICGHQAAPVPAEDVVDSSPIHQEDLDHS